MEVIGRIEKIETENGMSVQGKPYTRYVVHMDGKKYSTFDSKTVEGFDVGQNVKLVLEQNGKYSTLVKIESITEKISQPQPSMAQNQGVIATTEGIGKIEHLFQSQYEFGPANNRHTIKYFTIAELLEKKKALEEAGLITEI